MAVIWLLMDAPTREVAQGMPLVQMLMQSYRRITQAESECVFYFLTLVMTLIVSWTNEFVFCSVVKVAHRFFVQILGGGYAGSSPQMDGHS